MRILAGGRESGRGSPKLTTQDLQNRRRGLLAKVHIALKDLSFADESYRDLLERLFGVPTAAALSMQQLELLVKTFQDVFGWKPQGSTRREPKVSQDEMLRVRIEGLADQLANGEKRLQGLCKAICGMDRLDWCRDIPKLKQLLAVLGRIKRQETEGG